MTTVQDLQDPRFQFVQSDICINNLNEQYDTDFSYFFYEYVTSNCDYPIGLWGSTGCKLNSMAQFITHYV